MRLVDFAVRNPAFMAVLCLLQLALGVVAWQRIARAEDPSFPISSFTVVARLPGADPQAVEQQLVKPIEDAIHTLDDLRELVATASEGVAVVRVDFDAQVDVERRHDELQRALDGLRERLPEGLAGIEIRKANPGNVNIVQFALVSPGAAWTQLEDLATALRDRLETLPGVDRSQVWAVPERELAVRLDYAKLDRLQLAPGSVHELLRSARNALPAGALEGGGQRYSLEPIGGFDAADALRDTVLRTSDGGPGGDGGHGALRLGDVARIGWEQAPAEHLARFDGERAVYVTANQKPLRNIFETRAQILAAAEAFRATLPAGVRLELGFDQSRLVERRLGRLGHDLQIAIGLVLLTLLPLGLRLAGVVMVAIPLSLASGLALLFVCGQSLNQLSIAGFIIALGLLVDDSIVVAENIARHLRAGLAPDEAARRATRQIATAVLGCTATLMFAFLPLLALSSNSGKFIRSLPLAVLFTVGASLLTALTVIPFLASRLLKAEGAHDGNRVLRGLTRSINRVYTPLLRIALARPKSTLALAAALCAAAAGLLPLIGKSLFPVADTPQFLVQVNAPNGTALAATDAIARRVEARLLALPEVTHVLANVGHGNPQVFYNVTPRDFAASQAELFVQLAGYDPQATPALLRRLRGELRDEPGADLVVREFENGPALEAPVALRVVGPELAQLRRLAGELDALMQATPGLRDIGNPLRRSRSRSLLRVAVDPAKQALLGVPAAELGRTLRLAASGLTLGERATPDGRRWPVRLRGPDAGRPSLSLLAMLPVASRNGGLLPVGQLASLQLAESPPRIERRNRERIAAVTAYTEPGYNRSALSRELLAKAARLALPPGYRIEAGGEAERRKESFAGLGAATVVAIAGILAILVLEFGSFRSTLIAAAVIPLGLLGGIALLWACRLELGFTAMIGFIALIGIEIKNAILLVDFTNQLRAEGRPLQAAIAEAGEARFLPILLTSATAIGGLLPLAIQHSPLYSPMAIVIIGGLLSSTLLGRLVTPVLYQLLAPELAPPTTR